MYLGHIDRKAEASANPGGRLVTEPALMRVYGRMKLMPESTGKMVWGCCMSPKGQRW